MELNSLTKLFDLVVLSRMLMAGSWLACAMVMRHYREIPYANQAAAGILAMTLAMLLMIFDLGMSKDVLLFFIALSQMVVVMSFIKIITNLIDEPVTLKTLGAVYGKALLIVLTGAAAGLAILGMVHL